MIGSTWKEIMNESTNFVKPTLEQLARLRDHWTDSDDLPPELVNLAEQIARREAVDLLAPALNEAHVPSNKIG